MSKKKTIKRPVAANEVFATLRQMYGAGGSLPEIMPTAFDFLNDQLGGWRTGLHLIGGEPGCGKTSFALFNAAVAARAGHPVLYLSFDVEARLLVLKLLCQQAGLDSRAVLDGTVEQAAFEAALTAHGDDFERISVLEAEATLAAEAVEAMAHERMAASGGKAILVIIDYLQIWAAGARQFSEFRHEIGKLMTAMRRLALRLDSPVLAISSQNRQRQGEAVLGSLEGTSDLEYSADSVSFLINVERPSSGRNYAHPDDVAAKSRSVSINLRKNRFGETGSRVVKFLPQTGAFDEETVRRAPEN
ncbi:MAG: DnaB-like helicase C-terminal domain-containing protein [Alphaproteobacteria bacterium]|nr:DnaB-like helicase C-terminal domain-containing protein [Alphaproteobacteria bacterium]MDP6566057.1 DnaB-like helicase C-terminal domain-containing protein [Alphaproteobacteria bacterium]MDP6812883.1 DnaB-like helicase C-terminal domain-containing protein [Alphaproteobacteria bacterium]